MIAAAEKKKSGKAKERKSRRGDPRALREFSRQQYKESIIYKGGRELREYQCQGLNWLVGCWYRGQNSILADEMVSQ